MMQINIYKTLKQSHTDIMRVIKLERIFKIYKIVLNKQIKLMPLILINCGLRTIAVLKHLV